MIGLSQTPLPDNTQHSQEKTSIHLAGFESAISASERPQTHAFDRAATAIGLSAALLPVKAPVPTGGGLVGPRAGLDRFSPTGNRTPDRPARSELLSRPLATGQYKNSLHQCIAVAVSASANSWSQCIVTAIKPCTPTAQSYLTLPVKTRQLRKTTAGNDLSLFSLYQLS